MKKKGFRCTQSFEFNKVTRRTNLQLTAEEAISIKCLFLVWSSSGSPPHWRTKIEEYKYLGMDVNLSDVITNLQENLNT